MKKSEAESIIEPIVDMILQAADKIENKDKVSRIHAVLMDVSIRVGEEMRRIRDNEQNRSDG